MVFTDYLLAYIYMPYGLYSSTCKQKLHWFVCTCVIICRVLDLCMTTSWSFIQRT